MPYCPICQAEYRSGICVCAACEVELVSCLEDVRPRMNEAEIETYLSKRELVVLAHSTFDKLKPVRDLFCKNNIPSIILRGEACGAGCSCKGGLGELDLLVAEQDVKRALEILETQFSEMIGSVAEDAELDLIEHGRAELDLEAEDLICPACGGKLAAGNPECPECGLYLGIPE